MTWPELIKQKIESLEKHRAAEVRKLDKIRGDDSINKFAKKVELQANIKSLNESINVLYSLMGNAEDVTE